MNSVYGDGIRHHWCRFFAKSAHGIVFAGSGGFKTTSVTVPTALKWGGSLVVLDPSSKVAPMVIDHRRKAGRKVIVLDPETPTIGFNALDWIGRFGATKGRHLDHDRQCPSRLGARRLLPRIGHAAYDGTDR